MNEVAGPAVPIRGLVPGSLRRLRPALAVKGTSSLWTGRLEFAVMDRHGGPICEASIVARLDHVMIWFGPTCLAVIDRDRLRGWLHAPTHPLEQDDIVLERTNEGRLSLSIAGRLPDLVPAEVVDNLYRWV
ncbi:hypothetical protein GCM10022223_36940 [Kineosporia mesophila]|uniref:Uncharacterized protein n=1 Tax=Kineosporia mesophila TaxID=566012 RepID=A0ABP6ZQC6_9ACTN|nr:hypothetical protein [Kineosporia mesophila]MCD5349879.1 hypothetical protein [Kineosporia mesophila]